MQSLVFIAALAALLPLSSAVPFPVKTALNCRKSPTTSAAVVRTYPKGHDIKITCQTTGPSVNGENIWDKTSDGCYVADYYVKTGSSGFVAPRCPSSGGGGGGGGGGTCKAPPLNAATVDLIKKSEGFVRSPKPDPIGLPTVGYGHLCKTKGCSEVKYKFPLTPTTAAELLQDDAKPFETCIKDMLNSNVKLNDNQYGALVSWAFNVGCPNARSSQLRKRLNAGQNPNTVAAQELPKWNKAGSPLRVFRGLTTRRANEVELFRTASSKQALPVRC